MRRTLSLVLLAALVVDVAYGIATTVLQLPYGCSQTNLTYVTLQPNQSATSNGPDWGVLVSPCFYVSYFGLIGGPAFVMALFAPPRKKRQSAQETVVELSG